jgi:hypothetical protein
MSLFLVWQNNLAASQSIAVIISGTIGFGLGSSLGTPNK